MKKIVLASLVLIATSLVASDGAALTRKCAGCHGLKFDKAPLGRAKHTVKGKSKEHIVKMLKYYKNPEEADEMIMKSQVSNLTDKQIDTIAEYILGLK